jgi:hypothetical protein
VAISRIFKYKKEHENVAVPNREPHKQLRRWIVNAKATSKKIIAQGSGNPKFALPNLKLLHELGIIQLPHNFKLLEKNNNNVCDEEGEEEEDNKGTSKGKCSVCTNNSSKSFSSSPQEKYFYTTPKGQGQGTHPIKDEIEDFSQENKECTTCNGKGVHWTKNILQTTSKSTQVPYFPARTSPRFAATASNIARQHGTSSISVLNNPFSKIESTPAHPSEVPSP